MKHTTKSIIAIVLLMIAFGCGPSQRELAVQQINLAKQSLLQQDTMLAISQLDSVKLKYPKADVQKVVAQNMLAGLYRELVDGLMLQQSETDSIIIELEKKFVKQKTEFDQYIQYIPKRQSFDRTWDRSFIQVNLDERGELYLTSNYMGENWLEHTGIRVYDGNLQAKTEKVPLDDPFNHRSDFLDYKWEKVSYLNGKSDSIIQFIAENPKLDLKCVFLGKRYYYILLEDYDIQAIVDALSLSQAIKKKKSLADQLQSYRNIISSLQ